MRANSTLKRTHLPGFLRLCQTLACFSSQPAQLTDAVLHGDNPPGSAAV